VPRKPRFRYPAVDADTLWNGLEAIVQRRRDIRAAIAALELTNDARRAAELDELRRLLAAVDNAAARHAPKLIDAVGDACRHAKERVAATVLTGAYESAIREGAAVREAVSRAIALQMREQRQAAERLGATRGSGELDEQAVADLTAVITGDGFAGGVQPAIENFIARFRQTPASADEIAQTRELLVELSEAEGVVKQARCLAALLLGVDPKTVERHEATILPRKVTA
jgi:hypothetical protein